MACSCGDLFLGLIAILFPPIAGTYFLDSFSLDPANALFLVWIKSGLCSADSLINILLCMLGYLPGLIHAWYIISKYPECDHDYEPIDDAEANNSRVTYYYIRHEQPNARPQNENRTYGTQAGIGGPSVPESSRPAAQGPSTGAGSAEGGAPPSYSEVVKGDNKVQSQN
jgi:uncharacterized membrane protein YqaE (UPF0057 family)